MTKVPPCGSDKIPEKIYRLYRFPHGELAYQEDIKPCTPSEEYIRADLVEPSYGAEKIIRGNGKMQDEYILTSLHDKKVEDFKQLLVLFLLYRQRKLIEGY